MFHLATTITTPWSREKKVFFISPLCSLMKKEKSFFLFINYDHCAMIKRKKIFFAISYDDHYAMTKREKSFFHSATFSTSEERKILFFIYSVRSVCHDKEWKFFFIELLLSLRYDQERRNFFFHLATTITTPWSREKKDFFI